MNIWCNEAVTQPPDCRRGASASLTQWIRESTVPSKGQGDQRPEEGAGGQDLSEGGQPGRQSGISDQWPTRRLAWPAALSDDTHRCSNTTTTLGKAWLLVRPGHYTCYLQAHPVLGE